METIATGTRAGAISKATTSGGGWISKDVEWIDPEVGAVVVTCVTVQQHAARTVGFVSGALLSW